MYGNNDGWSVIDQTNLWEKPRRARAIKFESSLSQGVLILVRF